MTTRRWLALLLAVALGLRIWMAAGGGQEFWPDESRYGDARAAAGDYRHDERLVLLRSFGSRGGGDPDVPDPYYGEDADFEGCLDLVVAGCTGLVDHLADRLDERAGSDVG